MISIEQDISLDKIKKLINVLARGSVDEIDDIPILLERLFVLSKRLLVRSERLEACVLLLQCPLSAASSTLSPIFKAACDLAISGVCDNGVKRKLFLFGIQQEQGLLVTISICELTVHRMELIWKPFWTSQIPNMHH